MDVSQPACRLSDVLKLHPGVGSNPCEIMLGRAGRVMRGSSDLNTRELPGCQVGLSIISPTFASFSSEPPIYGKVSRRADGSPNDQGMRKGSARELRLEPPLGGDFRHLLLVCGKEIYF